MLRASRDDFVARRSSAGHARAWWRRNQFGSLGSGGLAPGAALAPGVAGRLCRASQLRGARQGLVASGFVFVVGRGVMLRAWRLAPGVVGRLCRASQFSPSRSPPFRGRGAQGSGRARRTWLRVAVYPHPDSLFLPGSGGFGFGRGGKRVVWVIDRGLGWWLLFR